MVGCLGALAAAFAVLTTLALDHRAGLLTLGLGVAAIVLWGAASTALPPMLQAAAMRSAPADPDGASGLYIAAFQIGIMAGSLAGGLLYETGRTGRHDRGVGASWCSSRSAGVALTRGLFDDSPGNEREVTLRCPTAINTAAQRP